ncbi:MAG: TIGR00282 family metallophosphoesterase [Bdellovibrionales bacterium]|nr:TIGR00282 family metallophosphoesterase [Bdellovibrionales bacterium]
MVEKIRILALGDIVSKQGRSFVAAKLKEIRENKQVDFVIANSENASSGNGITPAIAHELFESGVDFITLGDHVWRHKEVRNFLDNEASRCIRPANFPVGVPGRGWSKVEIKGVNVGVINLIGRVFFNTALDCPFQAVDRIIKENLNDCQIIICDFHAEATAEKIALAIYLKDRASFVFGTHTHVQTADEKIIDKTAYITDLGMCGPAEGVIGMDYEASITRIRMGLPSAYKAAKGKVQINGAVVEINARTGQALKIERIQIESKDI